MTTYKWTTEKGANVEVTISEVKEVINADGHKIETNKIYKQIDKFVVNGTEYKASFGWAKGKTAIEFKIGSQEAAAIIPENIYKEMFAKEIAAQAASIKAEKEYQKHYNRVRKAMEEKD